MPNTPVLPISNGVGVGPFSQRPASATPAAAAAPTNRLTSEEYQHNTFQQPQFSQTHPSTHSTPLTARGVVGAPLTPASPSSGALVRPSTAGSSVGRINQSALYQGNKDYQAIFLSAVDARHRSEADRLTMLNRLSHLRSQEEKAERACALTESQIVKVQLARQRHQQESAQRQIVTSSRAEERARIVAHMKFSHARRREAFHLYKQELLHLRKEQAQALRETQSELLAHRANMTAEDLAKYRIVRADIQQRQRIVRDRIAAQKEEELMKAQKHKQWKIILEEQRRIAADKDIRALQEEEARLLERASATRSKHDAAVDRLAEMVLNEHTLPTARARYVSIAALQGRASPRKVQQNSMRAAAAATTAPPSAAIHQSTAAPSPNHANSAVPLATGVNDHTPNSLMSGLKLSLPTSAQHHAINHNRHTTRQLQEQEERKYAPSPSSAHHTSVDEEEKQPSPPSLAHTSHSQPTLPSSSPSSSRISSSGVDVVADDDDDKHALETSIELDENMKSDNDEEEEYEDHTTDREAMNEEDTNIDDETPAATIEDMPQHEDDQYTSPTE